MMGSMNKKSGATTIKRIRLACGLNQVEFAKAIQSDRNAIGAYEAGKRQPGYLCLRRIVEFANKNGMDVTYTDIKSE